MNLLDTLRKRSERRTETVDCGGLGGLTVQALPLRDCAALSCGADGNRAVLFAACRDLQTAGELLRGEGAIFTPEEIMQYISDEEAAKGGETVRRISGLSEMTEGRHEIVQDTEKCFDEIRPKIVQKRSPENADDTDQLPSRHEIVQGFENQDSEIRPKSVQKNRGKAAPQSGDFAERTAELGGTTAGSFPENAAQKTQNGQVSHEFYPPSDPVDNPGDKDRNLSKMDRKPQNMVVPSVVQPQNVEKIPLDKRMGTKWKPSKSSENSMAPPARHPDPSRTAPTTSTGPENDRETLHEIAPDPVEGLHEITSETEGKTVERLHEIASEPLPGLHEITSEAVEKTVRQLHEIASDSVEGLHEIASEYPEKTADGLHGNESESVGNRGEQARKNRSKFDEATADFDDRMAWALLEGLLRAAGAR